MAERIFKNTLLRHLRPEIIERLDLQPISFEMRHEIEFPGKPIDRLYFLESGMASMTATFLDGVQVEVTMFGYESVIGVSALMGTRRSLHRVYTQIPGQGYFCSLQNAEREFARCERFQHLTLRYVQAQLSQALQSSACNIRSMAAHQQRSHRHAQPETEPRATI
jgi:CRP-like cAMP-binding protein